MLLQHVGLQALQPQLQVSFENVLRYVVPEQRYSKLLQEERRLRVLLMTRMTELRMSHQLVAPAFLRDFDRPCLCERSGTSAVRHQAPFWTTCVWMLCCVERSVDGWQDQTKFCSVSSTCCGDVRFEIVRCRRGLRATAFFIPKWPVVNRGATVREYSNIFSASSFSTRVRLPASIWICHASNNLLFTGEITFIHNFPRHCCVCFTARKDVKTIHDIYPTRLVDAENKADTRIPDLQTDPTAEYEK